MAFEFFFGIFGLISSDSKSRHQLRLENEWRLSAPLNLNLFHQDLKQQQQQQQQHHYGANLSSPLVPPAAGAKGQQSAFATPPSQSPIFSTSGTLANLSSPKQKLGQNSGSEGNLSSSFSNSSANSSSAFIKHHSSGGSDQTIEQELIIGSAAPTAADQFGHSTGPLRAGRITQEGVAMGGGGQRKEKEKEEKEKKTSGGANRFRQIYCLVVCLLLWLFVLRLLVGFLVDKSLVTLDFYYLGTNRIHFLIPALCLAIQAAAVSIIFIRNNDETNWLVPFYSSKDYLIRSRSNFKPKLEDYTRRVNISVVLALLLASVSSLSITAYLVHCVGQSELLTVATPPESSGAADTQEQPLAKLQSPATDDPAKNPAPLATPTTTSQLEHFFLLFLLALDVWWAIYSTYICFLVSFYFNLICSIMKSRFHGISKIIEDLAESNTTKTTNQARKITTLYLEHNEACELLDESNDFWQYLIFFTYFTYIPAYCYCLYNLFFVNFEAWPSFITWVIHTHTGFIILLISFSAAGVSTEVDGSGPSCLFNELTLDHRHIKYRSVANASWFLGFDKLGNPISGQELIKRDVEDAAKLDDAIGRERCYLFTKTNRLTTSTQFFPEALELIRQQQQPKPNVSSADYTSEQPSQMYQSALVATMFNKKQSADQTSPIVATQATGSGRPVYAFNQKQLINMTRYRNILRYQLGLRGNQPLSDP